MDGGTFVSAALTGAAFSALDDPAALSASDMYTLTIRQGTATLASWSGPAPYQTTFPNGMQCDLFACRVATVEVH